MFQLIYLEFTQPRADENSVHRHHDQRQAGCWRIGRRRRTSPSATTLQSALSQGHFRARPFTPALVDEMNLDKSMAFYKDRFADASDFTFVFVGSFTVDQMKPLVERYLGALPATHRTETWKDNGPNTPRNAVIDEAGREGHRAEEPGGDRLHGSRSSGRRRTASRLRSMADVLQTRLRETLREELGGTYSVSVSPELQQGPDVRVQLSISVRLRPDAHRRARQARLRGDREAEGRRPDREAGGRREGNDAPRLRDAEQGERLPAHEHLIALRVQRGPEGLLRDPGPLSRADVATIQQAAKTYLDTKNYVQVTLFPEKK